MSRRRLLLLMERCIGTRRSSIFHHDITNLVLLRNNYCTSISYLGTNKKSIFKILVEDKAHFCNKVSSNEIQNLASSIMDSNPNLCSERRDELVKILDFLVLSGCSPEVIREKCLDHIASRNSSYIKALMISEINQDVSKMMPLMTLSLVSLRLAAKQARDDKMEIEGFPNRISYLSYHLETPEDILIHALAKHASLLTMKFKRLQHKMDILKDAEIDPKYIIKDLWIFNYNERLLASRIKAANQAGVTLKPWMLRCSEKTFVTILSKYSETQRILNGEDEISYLANKLDCKKEYVEYLMERNKLLKTINIPKIEQVINFLYSQGYTPQEVRLFPRIFCSSVQTLSERLENFKSIKSTLPTMSQLCSSYKNYKSAFEKK